MVILTTSGIEDIELDENGNPILKDVAIVDSRGGTISIVVNNSVRKAPFQILKVLAPEAPAPHNASGWEFYVCTTNDPEADPIYTGVTNEDGIVVFDGYTLTNPPLVVEGTHLYIFERGYVGTDTYIQSHYKPSTEPVDLIIAENRGGAIVDGHVICDRDGMQVFLQGRAGSGDQHGDIGG